MFAGWSFSYRFSAFWLRSKCSICSYQLNIWYEVHVASSILNSFLQGDWTWSLLRFCHESARHCSAAGIRLTPQFSLLYMIYLTKMEIYHIIISSKVLFYILRWKLKTCVNFSKFDIDILFWIKARHKLTWYSKVHITYPLSNSWCLRGLNCDALPGSR